MTHALQQLFAMYVQQQYILKAWSSRLLAAVLSPPAAHL